MIVDKFGPSRCVAQPVSGRSEAAELAEAIDPADVIVAELRDLVAGFEFGDADQFADQRLADEDRSPCYMILPELRTSRTWSSASNQGCSTWSGI